MRSHLIILFTKCFKVKIYADLVKLKKIQKPESLKVLKLNWEKPPGSVDIRKCLSKVP